MVVRDVPARRRNRCLAGVIVLLSCLLIAAPATSWSGSPIGVHSMLYVTDPFGAEQAMFQQAAAIGASTIRLDIALSGVFENPAGPPDWSGVDRYVLLAHRYHLRVLADLVYTPWYLIDCPPGVGPDLGYRCPPSDPTVWGQDAGAIAAHTRGVINNFEIINEPDGGWDFYGTPQQYAQVLSASYQAIHAANPNAHVALGGLMNIGPGGQAWLNQVLTTPGADAIHKFDIANIHVRTPAADVGAVVSGWRHYFTSNGFHGPLWVTETGYPADPAWQTELGYTDGPSAQARWLTTVIPAMLHAGASMVFVTERDSLSGRYASEGVLQTTDPLTADPPITRRPSFYAVRALDRRLASQAPGTSPPGTGTPPAARPAAQRVSLVLREHVSPRVAWRGQRLRYTITVTNKGPDTATRVRVTDTPGQFVRVLSIHPGRGRCRPGPPLTCTLGRLRAGAHNTITITTVATVAGQQTNAATVINASRAHSRSRLAAAST